MNRVLTITTNPAVDMSTTVAQVVAGPKLRCEAPRWDAGGGGVNVARAIKKLGGDALALVAVGGALGEKLLSLLAIEEVAVQAVPVSAETRISFAVTDDASNDQYRFGVPGNKLSAQDSDLLLNETTEVARGHSLAVFSGSVAPGLPDDFIGRIKSAIAAEETRLVVDTSAAGLAHLLDHPERVHVLRLDLAEAEAAARHSLNSIEESRNFAKTLVDRGVAEIVVMGRGADGSILVSADTHIHAWGPPVEVRSKIGAGDTFVGAFSLALSRNEPLQTALKRGVAGAAATVQTEGTALCDRQEADSLFAHCQCIEI